MSHIKDAEKAAVLARLDFSGEEKEKFAAQFDKIIGFVEKIAELDTENIQPMTHAVEKSNVFRADVVLPSMENGEIAGIAPKFAAGSFVVPKIIEY